MTDYDLPGFPPLHAALAEHFSQKQVAEIAATGISKNLWTRRKTGAGRDSGGRMSEFLASISGLGLADAGMAIWASMALLAVLAFILGFALNHGSICTVIATAELVSERRSARSIALVECAVWAALVYAILETSPTMQQGWSPLGYLVPGAMLFGIGTYVNGACVFGSVGHFGNGHIDFGLTFLAIFAVFYIESLFGLLPDQPPIRASLPLGPVLLAIALVAILALRLSVSLKSESNFRRLTLAMGAIGITFTILAVLTPRFSVTTSVGSIVSVPVAGAVTSVCMFGGSLVSARFRQRRFTLEWPTIENIVRRTLGGILMGLGALLIPGGNDTLLMIGFPMGAWQAALAYVLLVASVAALIAKFGSMARSWS